MKIVREAFLKAKNRVYKAESKKKNPERSKSNNESLVKRRKMDVIE